jgi:hypothetical protein
MNEPVTTDLVLQSEISVLTVMNQGEFQFFSVHDTGIAIKPECPEDVWRELATAAAAAFEHSGKTHCRMMAKLADVLNHGFAVFGERAASIVDATAGFMRLHAKTLDNAMACFVKIPEERRRVDDLSLEHHKLVSKLSAEEQEEFLTLAIDEGMSVSALREAVNARHPKNTAKSDTKRKASTDESITKKACLEAVQTIEDFFIQMEEEYGSAGSWEKEMKADFVEPFKRLNKICRRVAIPSHGKKDQAR